MDIDSIVGKLKATMMFHSLTDDELALLAKCGQIKVYAPGEYLISTAEVAESFFIIVNGNVSVLARGTAPDDMDVFISTLGDGEIIGEAGLFTKMLRTADVKAVDETTVLVFQSENLGNFIKSNPTAGNKFLLIVIYSLIQKLTEVRQDLVYERKEDLMQADIDRFIKEVLS